MTCPTTPIGSRRTQEVCPARYSPALRPSSTRAAPAKKRSWSTDGGTSSLTVSERGLPVSAHSRSTNSCARSSRESAMRSSASWRSAGVVRPQVSKARSAAVHAASTSAGEETGAWATTRPVAGSSTCEVGPSPAHPGAVDEALQVARR